MTRIPKLYESAEEAREPEVSDNLAPLIEARAEDRADLTHRRRKIAAVVTGLILAPIAVKAGIDSYGYGYHASQSSVAHHVESSK